MTALPLFLALPDGARAQQAPAAAEPTVDFSANEVIYDSEAEVVIASGQVQGQNDNVNFCLKDSSNSTDSCTSGQDGLGTGDSASGSFILDFGATTPEQIILSDFFVRFQGVGPNDDSFVTTPNGVIPEPATWGMMLLGFGAAGYALRRRRKAFLPQVA